jgi:tetratricopeptide (TPR) repeat protein
VSWEKQVLAAQGYTELGMFEEAVAELDRIEERYQRHPDVLTGRLFVLMQAKLWEPALEAARLLCKAAPDRSVGYIHSAFCLHELGRTEEARKVLIEGPDFLKNEPTYHYNLGCYEAVLGNVDVARAHVERSIQLDRNFRELARIDPDLRSLRDTL